MEGEEQGVQEEEEEEKDSIRIKGVELFGDLFRAWDFPFLKSKVEPFQNISYP